MNHPGRKGEVQAVAVATVDDLRERIRRKSKLKGRQPDDKSLAEVVSLVGPRPGTPEEVEKYEPWQRERLSIWPGLAILITVLSFNLFGDGLRDALDPYLKR